MAKKKSEKTLRSEKKKELLKSVQEIIKKKHIVVFAVGYDADEEPIKAIEFIDEMKATEVIGLYEKAKHGIIRKIESVAATRGFEEALKEAFGN